MQNSKNISQKIINQKIKKEEAKTLDFGGRGLVVLSRKFSRLMNRYFQREIKRYWDEISSNSELMANQILLDLQKMEINKSESPNFFTEMLNQIVWFMKSAFMSGVKKFSFEDKKLDFKINFEVQNMRAEDYAKERSAELITKIDEYTRKRINRLISKAVELGRGYDKIREKLMDDYSFGRYRATMIAHNELGNALTAGTHRQFQEYQSHYRITGWKRSISHPDDRRSEICRLNSEQGRIPADEPFQSGHMHPLFHINCRCRDKYRFTKPEDDE